MARPRSELQDILEAITPKVYFQPPASAQMEYPCIRYERDNGATEYANNKPYLFTYKYQVTLITRDPDDDIFKQIVALPMATHDRWYPADNLNHDVFTIYF